MAKKSPQKKPKKIGISPEQYRETLAGVELEDVRLVRARVELKGDKAQGIGSSIPAGLMIDIESKATYEYLSEDLCRVVHDYILTARNPKNNRQFFKIECSFSLLFKSKDRMDDDFFEVFKEVNLPLNTWPYVREFVDNMTTRMHIPPLTLPLIKRGI